MVRASCPSRVETERASLWGWHHGLYLGFLRELGLVHAQTYTPCSHGPGVSSARSTLLRVCESSLNFADFGKTNMHAMLLEAHEYEDQTVPVWQLDASIMSRLTFYEASKLKYNCTPSRRPSGAAPRPSGRRATRRAPRGHP